MNKLNMKILKTFFKLAMNMLDFDEFRWQYHQTPVSYVFYEND